MTWLQRNYLPLGVSLAIHLALLVFLTLIAMEPQPGLHWYEIEYRDPLARVQMDRAETGSPLAENLENEAAAAKGVLPGADPPRRETLGGSEAEPSQLNPAASDLIETPALRGEQERPGQLELGENPLARGALRGDIGSDQPDGSAISHKVTGGRVRFTLPADYKHNLGYPGSVTLQFKLDRYARPVTSSIIPLQQTGPRYFQAARKALLDGSFSFIGAPDPGATCQITLEFL